MAAASYIDEDMIFDPPLLQDDGVDYSSKNRDIVVEELEKKLRCRAERDMLVQKNILPAVSTSSIILAQTQQLQRAKTADTLQQKLRDRVSRSELHKRNILPDIKDAVDPSLYAHQLQLQKRKLADNLNDRIANRPGVLELVEDHILEPTNISLAQAAKSVRTSLVREDESDGSPPQRDIKTSDSSSPLQSPGDPYAEVLSPQKSPPRLVSPSGINALTTIVSSTVNRPTRVSSDIGKVQSPSQSRKKQQKVKYRKLRYHEYVPPTKSNGKGGKTAPSKPPKLDTPYALLLQQQQMFLQLQVLQQQYPNGVLAQKLPELLKNMPASFTEKAQQLLKPKTAGMDYSKSTCTTKTHEIPEDIKVQTSSGNVITVRLDELKVNHLKLACKEMNLIVSGKKVELIERLLEHNNGVLPSSVLQDTSKKSMSQHSSSFESRTSPDSLSPSPVFQYSKNLNNSSSSPSLFQSKESTTSAAHEATDVAEVIPAAEFQNKFDQLMEKQKVEYFSSKSMKAVAPRPDLKHMVAIKFPCSSQSSSSLSKVSPAASKVQQSSLIHSKSLPSSPQQLSPTESTNSLLQDLMEQSPLPSSSYTSLSSTSYSSTLPSSSYSPVSASTHVESNLLLTSSSSHFSSVPNSVMSGQYLSRSGRCSLPNPPPYPGLQPPSFDTIQSSYYTQSPVNALNQQQQHRSYSISGPATCATGGLTMDLPVLSQTNKPMLSSTDTFLFPADDNVPSSDLMDIDHSQLTDLLEIFDNGEQGFTSNIGVAQSTFNNHFHPSDLYNTMQHGNMFATSDPNITTRPAYSDMGWINMDGSSSNTMLSGSPNMHSFPPDMHTTLTSIHPYEHFQLGLDDSAIALKSSSGNINALATNSNNIHSFVEPSVHNGGLYGHEAVLMNLDLTS